MELFCSPLVCKQLVDLGGVSMSLTARLKTPHITRLFQFVVVLVKMKIEGGISTVRFIQR